MVKSLLKDIWGSGVYRNQYICTLSPQSINCLERIIGFGLVGRGVTLGMGSEV